MHRGPIAAEKNGETGRTDKKNRHPEVSATPSGGAALLHEPGHFHRATELLDGARLDITLPVIKNFPTGEEAFEDGVIGLARNHGIPNTMHVWQDGFQLV